ncbi:MAG: ATP-binding protein [Muribaculaceae bacterium]|nr:ATP-binding protein [Muribaculaceae bacterium]
MARALSNRNVCEATFAVANFDGPWLASLGRPELRGSWIIYGESGSGKTHFALQLLRYLSQFVYRVAYDSLEQGLSQSFQHAWIASGMATVGNKAILFHKEDIPELMAHLHKRKSPQIIVIDSITALTGFGRTAYHNLISTFPNKLFIFLAHEEGGRPYPTIARHVGKLSEIKMRVEGFRAFITTRFATEDGGGEPFTIWEEGAARYYADKN